MIVPYNSNCLYEDENGILYSCDMIRLQALLSDDPECEKAFNRYFNDETNMRTSMPTVSPAVGKYHYMWSIACQKTTITVLYQFNSYSDSHDDNRRVIVEFNPNKMDTDDRNQVDIILSNCVDIKVVRCDLAIDIPVDRKSVDLVKDQRNYEYQDHNENGITEYLGTRNNDNFVKLYDKTKESDLDYPLTRLEMTLKPSITEFRRHLPKVLVKQDNFQREMMLYDGLTNNNKIMISVLQTLDVRSRNIVLKSFNKYMRKKLSPYVLSDTYRLVVNENCVKSVFDWINNCVYYKRFK